MKLPCGCCEGVEALTPVATANRPGLGALTYRAGTHATFFETMQARLSQVYVELPTGETDETGKPKTNRVYPLRGLTTRESSDPSIALLDAWATLGDVLAYYQERIANEGYLRTATERRSILELARLVGYRLRPGVASSVFLAYTIEKDSPPAEIPMGARASSIPAPGEQMQSFETSEPLKARFEWNELKPRMAQPQTPQSILQNGGLYLKGMATNLKPNDALLIDFAIAYQDPQPFRVYEVEPDNKADRTLITLRTWSGGVTASPAELSKTQAGSVFKGIFDQLQVPPSIPPASTQQLARSVQNTFAVQADIFPKLLSALLPRLGSALYPALGNAEVTQTAAIKVYALRVRASLFGHNAPAQPEFDGDTHRVTSYIDPELSNMWRGLVSGGNTLPVIALDASYDKIQPGSFVVVDRPVVASETRKIAGSTTIPSSDTTPVVTLHRATTNRAVTMSGLGVSAKVTQLGLAASWLADVTDNSRRPILASTPVLRETLVYAESELLDLADEPIDDPVCDDTIELGALYDGLESGCWMIVSGERADITGTSGVRASELVMLAGVTHATQPVSTDGQTTMPPLAGNKLHTFVTFSEKLAYRYKRDTVTIFGNVVHATHGETRNEVLGAGDAAKALQTFVLKQPPLTFVSAPTASGIDSTLELRINDVLWHEADSLAYLGPNDRSFVTVNDDDAKTSVIFGNGVRGARLPTGAANVKAKYRNGIGKPGNVKAEQISLLATRPLGVKAVINPLRASGGADKESRDQARSNAPLAVMALDRLVSTQDYADFARTFAGVGKASAARLPDGHRQLVHVTIAGADDIPIVPSSDLFRNLTDALHRYGDPYLPVSVAVRELLALLISANVRVLPDYQWESVEPNIRAALLDAFGFERRELGQDVAASEVIATIQRVRGVDYVDLDFLASISEAQVLEKLTAREVAAPGGAPATGADFPPSGPEKIGESLSPGKFLKRGVPPRVPVRSARVEHGGIQRAQLAYLQPGVPDTLILNEVKS